MILTRWKSDRFIRGSYSFVGHKADGTDYEELAKPHNGRIYFAGEGTNVEHPTTVAGAFLSGLREAGNIERNLKEEREGKLELRKLIDPFVTKNETHADVSGKRNRIDLNCNLPERASEKKQKFEQVISSILNGSSMDEINPELRYNNKKVEKVELPGAVEHTFSPNFKSIIRSEGVGIPSADDFYAHQSKSPQVESTPMLKHQVKERVLQIAKDYIRLHHPDLKSKSDLYKLVTKKTTNNVVQNWESKGCPKLKKFMNEKRIQKIHTLTQKYILSLNDNRHRNHREEFSESED